VSDKFECEKLVEGVEALVLAHILLDPSQDPKKLAKGVIGFLLLPILLEINNDIPFTTDEQVRSGV